MKKACHFMENVHWNSYFDKNRVWSDTKRCKLTGVQADTTVRQSF